MCEESKSQARKLSGPELWKSKGFTKQKRVERGPYRSVFSVRNMAKVGAGR